MKTQLVIVLIFAVLANLIFAAQLRGDTITANSKAVGSSKASKGGNAVTVVTSASNASKLTNNIYKSKNVLGLNANVPATNII